MLNMYSIIMIGIAVATGAIGGIVRSKFKIREEIKR